MSFITVTECTLSYETSKGSAVPIGSYNSNHSNHAP